MEVFLNQKKPPFLMRPNMEKVLSKERETELN